MHLWHYFSPYCLSTREPIFHQENVPLDVYWFKFFNNVFVGCLKPQSGVDLAMTNRLHALAQYWFIFDQRCFISWAFQSRTQDGGWLIKLLYSLIWVCVYSDACSFVFILNFIELSTFVLVRDAGARERHLVAVNVVQLPLKVTYFTL